MKSKNIIQIGLFTLAALITNISCKKFVQIPAPTTQIAATTVYSNNASAAAVMTGMYSNMMGNTNLASGFNSISELQGLAADELTNYDPSNLILSQFYTNSLSSSTNGNSNNYYWTELYNEIHVANAVIEGLNNSTGVSVAMKKQLDGEAKFVRAFLFFYAVNLYGDVPLATTTDYQVNNLVSRSPSTDVYQQIVRDLKDAKLELSDNYLDSYGATTTDRIRPNRGAAEALLARTYLYTGKWDSAETEATNVINNTAYSLDSDMNQVFLGNSTEAIWQLMPVSPGYNTFDGLYFVLSAPPGSGSNAVALSSQIYAAFEPDDERLLNWIGTFDDNGTTYYYANKYKIGTYDPNASFTEFVMVLRLAELYLIRAEARAQKGNINGSQADLDVIRTRAGLPGAIANDQPSLMAAILHERQTELFTEWGHRWLDLKRTGMLNSVMSTVVPQKGGTWDPKWALLPIPLSDLKIDHNLLQNPGYN